MPEGGWEQLVVWLLLGVLPWIFVVAGSWFLYRAHRFMSGAKRIAGSVKAVHSSTSRKKDGQIVTAYRPVFIFTDADGSHREAETFLTSTRVWTQFSQHLIAKMWSIERKFCFSFSYRVVSRLISFIRQKNRSTRLRMA